MKIDEGKIKILDSTKLNSFMTCPRRFFYEHVLGWRPPYANHDLHFGQAVHLALEHIYECARQGRPLYDSDDLADGFQAFASHYRLAFGPETDLQHKKKNPFHFAYMLESYARRYLEEDLNKTVVHTEVSGSVPVGRTPDGSDKLIFFRLDTLMEDQFGRRYILEHKTSQWSPSLWAETWSMAIQPIVGCMALYLLYGEKSKGLILNGLFFTTKAESPDFLRLPIQKQPKALEMGRTTLEAWFDAIQAELDILYSDPVDDLTLRAFPCNGGSCLKYNRQCIYHDLCLSLANPLSIEGPPSDLVVDYWDPREGDKTYTKHVEIKKGDQSNA